MQLPEKRSRTFNGPTCNIQGISFSHDGKRLLLVGTEGITSLNDIATGETLCSIVSFSDGNWAVFDPQQHYDASNPDFLAGLYWVAGNETFDLGKFKDKFYEPGLLAKKMGFEKKPLRAVVPKRN